MAKVTFRGIGVQNLGPFKSRQYLNLQVRASRPIILVKALNGSGKTTLLAALQVVLYGNRAVGNSRGGEYDQLIRGLHRSDADGPARVDLDLAIEINGEVDRITVSREWMLKGEKLSEQLSVHREGSRDFQLTEDWDEYLDNILPAELMQLFLFDGEKIEALANPKTLPDMLRRATEAFLGIGGIDSLSKDLVAVERRALLRAREHSNDYGRAQRDLLDLEKQHSEICKSIAILTQSVGSAQQSLDQARQTYDRFASEAQRSGLSAYEKAAEIRAAERQALDQVAQAEEAVREALADPLAPFATLGELWTHYKDRWFEERDTKAAKLLSAEILRRDKRIVQSLKSSVTAAALSSLKQALSLDADQYKKNAERSCVLIESVDPGLLEQRIQQTTKAYQDAVHRLDAVQVVLSECQAKLALIPEGERLAELLSRLQQHASLVASAEAEMARAQQQLYDQKASKLHIESRVSGAQQRLSKDFRGQAHDEKAIAAGQRARAVLTAYKDKLMASKAQWLSDMITNEFKGLMRKQRLISRVQVDPDSYAVSIAGAHDHELPMERLSAGERQLLAVAVLSALIRERKGRFPVVVDTPLARLDRSHRESLIRRFFAKVSHQVVVLSTDEEVEGTVFDQMSRYTAKAYQLDFSDEDHCSRVTPLEISLEH